MTARSTGVKTLSWSCQCLQNQPLQTLDTDLESPSPEGLGDSPHGRHYYC